MSVVRATVERFGGLDLASNHTGFMVASNGCADEAAGRRQVPRTICALMVEKR